MKREMKKYAVVALAGAASLVATKLTQGAITIVGTKVGTEVVNAAPGNSIAATTYDIIDFNLTSLTGVDSATLTNGSDPGLINLQGTWAATGTGALLGTPGTNSASGTYAFGKYLTDAQGAGGAPPTAAPVGTTGFDVSYVALDSVTAATVRGSVVNAFGSKGSGSGSYNFSGGSSSINNDWYTNPASGGEPIEPASAPAAGTQVAASNGGVAYTEVWGPQSLVAQMLVTSGGGVSFTGKYGTDGSAAFTQYNFAYTPTSSGPTTGAQKVISLMNTAPAAGSPPAGYGNNPIATLAVGPNGKAASVNLGGTGATSGYVAVTGGPAPYYALSLDVNGVAATASALQQIVGDINNNSTGVTATYLASGGAFGLGFAPGILLSDSVAGSSQYFSFDFSSSGSDLSLGDTTLGPVTVVAIAAVPEPATAAGIIIGASGLLLGRRRNKSQVA